MPSTTRRTFLQQLSAAALASRSALAGQTMEMSHPAPAPAQGSPSVQPAPQHVKMLHVLELPPFVDELPLPELIPAKKHGKLRITMREVHAKVHRDVPPTRLWSYGSGALAPLIEARSHQTLRVEWVNQLPERHFLPVDHSLHGCGREVPEVRACVHLHGGRTPSESDGYPEDWYPSGKSRVCTYPLEQDATALWYHDHAMGLNRLNIYAGLFGMFLLRDEVEDRLNLPSGKYEVPLLLYDRSFTSSGDLLYPQSGDPEHPWVTEFYGDAILINGKIRPFQQVEPRLYRFRVLNASNSRFFQLSLTDHAPFHQIGTDQGLLAAPLKLTSLMIAPAERVDLLIDFSDAAGQQLHLIDGAFQMMEFRVGARTGKPEPQAPLPAMLRTIERIPESQATVTRTITLDELHDRMGAPMLMLLNHKHWHEPVTETPKLNSTEIWEFVNTTEDTHPMHLHLVRFQVLDRRAIDVFAYQNRKGLRFLGAARPAEANEGGWKDVVQCNPGETTRIIARFDGYPGRYLYHCHILEHEANDMMRPYEVMA